MDVTIIIVNWNTRPLLQACLRAVTRAVEGLAAQVIVVDNGSTDGSSTMVAEVFPQIELMRNVDNVGFARANNQACVRATGRYVLLLNPDTEVQPKAVSRMVQYLDATPACAGVTAVLRNPDGSLQRYHKQLPRWMSILWSETVLRNLSPANRWLREFYMLDVPFDTVTDVEQPPAACLMLRRSLFGREPIFDDRFPIFYNDVDLCRRLYDAGRPLRILPEAEVLHHGGAGGVGSLPDQGVADCLIGLVRYYRKHEGVVAAALLWSVLTLNSLLVLSIGLGKVIYARRPLSWWRQEAAKRLRMAAGRETFQYPLSEEGRLVACTAPCRH
ncbi:MAG: glycosyltransferase family 2 protein [Nitrospira sp.]